MYLEQVIFVLELKNKFYQQCCFHAKVKNVTLEFDLKLDFIICLYVKFYLFKYIVNSFYKTLYRLNKSLKFILREVFRLVCI